MAKQTIGLGSSANDGTGDTLRTGGDKINDNFDELYGDVAPRISGRYYPIQRNAQTAAGTASGLNQIRWTPFTITSAIAIDRIVLNVTAVSVGQNTSAAIYAADATTKMPTGNALASTGSVASPASAGEAEGTISSTTLQPGLYWLGTNNSDTTIALGAVNIAGSSVPWLIGVSAAADCFVGNNMGLSINTPTVTFGTWPDMTSGTVNVTSTATNVMPFAFFRIA